MHVSETRKEPSSMSSRIIFSEKAYLKGYISAREKREGNQNTLHVSMKANNYKNDDVCLVQPFVHALHQIICGIKQPTDVRLLCLVVWRHSNFPQGARNIAINITCCNNISTSQLIVTSLPKKESFFSNIRAKYVTLYAGKKP